MSGKRKILIADDDSYVHEMLIAALSSEGFEVIHAYDGRETLKQVENEHPDLIILDVIMPLRDGRDICGDLKKNSVTKDIRILMLSAKDEQYDRIVGLEIGADEYMIKPFSVSHVISKIKKMFRKE